MTIERRNISVQEITDPELEMRAGTDETGKRFIEGYASLFNLESRTITEKINGQTRSFIEVIKPTAWIGTDMTDVQYNVNHDPYKMVARTAAKNLQVRATDKGLWFRASIPNTTTASDLYEDIKVGNYRENSFAFVVKQDSWENRGGMLYREIVSIDRLHDVSSVLRGAYQADILFTRSLPEEVINPAVEEPKVEPAPAAEPTFDVATADLDFQMNILKNQSI